MSIHDVLMVLVGMVIAELIYITVDYIEYSRARRAFFSDVEGRNEQCCGCACDSGDKDSGENCR